MNYNFFLSPFFVSFLVSATLLFLIVSLNRRKSRLSRFGGVALIIAFVVAILLDKRLVITQPLFGVLLASIVVLIFGFIDDIKQLSWKTQLFFQVAIVSFVYFMGVRLEYISKPWGGIFFFHGSLGYFIGLLIAIVWMVLLMNSMNWLDGVDGASSGIAMIGAATIFFLSLRPEVNQPPIGIITAALLGGLFAFLLFNFHPAKILAGTSGSMFMGFVLAALAIFAGAKIATTLLVLAIPIVDALWVIGERYRSGESIFAADKRHLHYRLLQLGWSPKKICLFYYLITGTIAILALNTGAMGKAVTFTIVGMIMVGVLVGIRKKSRIISINQKI